MKRLIVIALFLSGLATAQPRDSTAVHKRFTARDSILARRTILFKFEFAVPIIGNPYWNEYEPDVNSDEDSSPWFLPAGLNLRAGAGLRLSKLFIIGFAGGMESRLDHKLVLAPLYGELTAMAPTPNGNHLFVNAGLGRAFALGRDGLSGSFRKVGLGFGNYNGAAFIELSQYGLNFKGMTTITNVSVGGTVRF